MALRERVDPATGVAPARLLCDYSWMDLSHEDLAQGFFAHADFNHADLRGTNLEGANLAFANLNGARLDWANLNLANLEGARMASTSAVGATFHLAVLSGISAPQLDCTNCDMRETGVDRSDFTLSTFSRAMLEGAAFEEVSILAADFTGAKMRWSEIVDSTADKSNFADCNCAGLLVASSSFKGAVFDGADLSFALFDRFTVTQDATFQGAAMEGMVTYKWAGQHHPTQALPSGVTLPNPHPWHVP